MTAKKEDSISVLQTRLEYMDKSITELSKQQAEARKENTEMFTKTFDKIDSLGVAFASRSEFIEQQRRIQELEAHQKEQDEKTQNLAIKFATWGGSIGIFTGIITFIASKVFS